MGVADPPLAYVAVPCSEIKITIISFGFGQAVMTSKARGQRPQRRSPVRGSLRGRARAAAARAVKPDPPAAQANDVSGARLEAELEAMRRLHHSRCALYPEANWTISLRKLSMPRSRSQAPISAPFSSWIRSHQLCA